MSRTNLYVRNTQKEAEKVLDNLGLDEEWLEAGIGTVLAGRLFDKIVFDVDNKYVPETKKSQIQAYKELCRIKLKPEGKFIQI